MEKIPQMGTKPDIQLSNIQMWIIGRQFPDSVDYWDVNWLCVAIHCGSENSDVWASGPIIFLSELVELKNTLTQLHDSAVHVTAFKPMEPNFSIDFELTLAKKVLMKVYITANHFVETHQYFLELRQEHLDSSIHDIEKVLELYPIIGSPKTKSH